MGWQQICTPHGPGWWETQSEGIRTGFCIYMYTMLQFWGLEMLSMLLVEKS